MFLDPRNDLSAVLEGCILECSEVPCDSILGNRICDNVESALGANICSLASATEVQIVVRSGHVVGPDHTLRMALETEISSMAKSFMKNDHTCLHRLSLSS